MSKREKSAEPELPLFDLPLHDDGEAPPPRPDRGKKRKRKKKPPAPEAPLLFSEEELAGADRAPAPEPIPREAFTEEASDLDGYGAPDEGGESAPSQAVLVQDRLLGGLADLTIHLATLGSMVVAVQLMGIPVALADWPPFTGLALIFSLLYSVIPLAFWGHTPGMAWVGHSARSDSDEPLSFGQTVLRWLGALVTVLLLGLPLLLAFRGRSLADRLSDSRTLQP